MSKKALQWSEDADIKRKPTYWISEWQGYLLYCPGRLKWFQDTPQVDFTAYLGGVESLNLACFGLVMEVVLTNRHLRRILKTQNKIVIIIIFTIIGKPVKSTPHQHLWMEMFTLNVSWAKGTLLVQLGFTFSHCHVVCFTSTFMI